MIFCHDYFSKFASKSYQDAELGCSYLKILLNPMMATYGLKNTEDEGDKGATFAFIIPLIEYKIADDDLGMQINQQQT